MHACACVRVCVCMRARVCMCTRVHVLSLWEEDVYYYTVHLLETKLEGETENIQYGRLYEVCRIWLNKIILFNQYG